MSIAKLNTAYWQALQPDGPFEAGAPGWASAPFVGWGENPDRAVPPMLATDGLGCGCTGPGRAVGADPIQISIWPLLAGYAVVGLIIWGAFKFADKAQRAR
jgi:hypothetical protein